MVRRYQPDGGRYTRPRRGFRAKSNYRERLRKRGLTSRDVRMESLDALRRKQGYVPRLADGIGSKRPAYKTLRDSIPGLQMPWRVPEVASDYEMEIRPTNKEVEQHSHTRG